MKLYWFFKILIFLCTLIFSGGCKTQKTKVFGVVKYQGVAVEKGIIDFDSVDGKANNIKAKITNGKFELSFELLREKSIYITRVWGYKNSGKKILVSGTAPGLNNGDSEQEGLVMYIPKIHNSFSKNIVQINSGMNNYFDLDLISPSD